MHARADAWDAVVHRVLARNEVRLVAHVPDKALAPLIGRLEADEAFRVLSPAREEEAVGIVAGACLGGLRGTVLMQTSGFATLGNALASLVVPYELPVVMIVSERGVLGDHQRVQALAAKPMRPILDALAIDHHTVARLDELEPVMDGAVRQAFATRAPVAILLSPLLTRKEGAG